MRSVIEQHEELRRQRDIVATTLQCLADDDFGLALVVHI